ncbi:DHS-like NAD/FAD-binding domain-containing protein [Scleroderma yunnanense]
MSSTPSPTKSKLIPGNDPRSVAAYMKSERCRNVFLMANLARLNLPYPEAVFQIDFFRANPVPFYTLAKELYPGRFAPTLTHTFISLLNTHSLLHTCFTQNIDTLERLAGVPKDKIIEAHGSFASQRCIECKMPFDDERMKRAVEGGEIPKCERRKCGGVVKPDIVFFGESLPKEFYSSIHSLRKADLLIIIGTSLTVHPFASLVHFVPQKCPRVLINLVKVGEFDRRDDVVLLGKCDDIVRELCRELEWEEELESMWRGVGGGGAQERGQAEGEGEDKEDALDKITKDMEKGLMISESDVPHPTSKTQEMTGSTDPTEENRKNVVNEKLEGDSRSDGKL